MDPDQQAAMQVPATFIDRFFLTVNADRVRIAFGEATPDGPLYSSAVAMSAENADQLIELLGRFLSRKAAAEDEGSDG